VLASGVGCDSGLLCDDVSDEVEALWLECFMIKLTFLLLKLLQEWSRVNSSMDVRWSPVNGWVQRVKRNKKSSLD
jgi:hypothetical protein